MSTTTRLRTLLDTYPHTRAIKDRSVTIPGFELEFVEIEPVHAGFGAMADRLEFDVAEMAITTYILARSFDKPLTALPVVVSRNFHHRRMVYNVHSAIKGPKDLEGRRVGIRSYTQTMPLWNRAVLKSEYGVDLDKITWVVFEDAHVKAFRNPPNAVKAPAGKTLGGMLLAGEIDAAIGEAGSSPDIRPLIPNAAEAEVDWYRRTGLYPVNHLITVKNDLVAAHPGILTGLFDAFREAKQRCLAHLAGPGPFSAADQDLLRRREILGTDPIPYGLEPNRKAMEAAAEFACDQRIVSKIYSMDELFLPEVRALG